MFIAPTSVKKCMGHGKLEKNEIARELLLRAGSIKTKNIIKSLIQHEDFDKTDSIAIALAAGIKYLGEDDGKKHNSKCRSNQSKSS